MLVVLHRLDEEVGLLLRRRRLDSVAQIHNVTLGAARLRRRWRGARQGVRTQEEGEGEGEGERERGKEGGGGVRQADDSINTRQLANVHTKEVNATKSLSSRPSCAIGVPFARASLRALYTDEHMLPPPPSPPPPSGQVCWCGCSSTSLGICTKTHIHTHILSPAHLEDSFCSLLDDVIRAIQD